MITLVRALWWSGITGIRKSMGWKPAPPWQADRQLELLCLCCFVRKRKLRILLMRKDGILKIKWITPRVRTQRTCIVVKKLIMNINDFQVYSKLTPSPLSLNVNLSSDTFQPGNLPFTLHVVHVFAFILPPRFFNPHSLQLHVCSLGLASPSSPSPHSPDPRHLCTCNQTASMPHLPRTHKPIWEQKKRL